MNSEANFYFIYSIFKGISGKTFDNLNDFIQYSSNTDDGTKFEYYYDQSFFIKLDFMYKNYKQLPRQTVLANRLVFGFNKL